MIMESDAQPVDEQRTDNQLADNPYAKENMAPQENDNVPESYESDSGEVIKSNNNTRYFSNHMTGRGRSEEYGGYKRVTSTDEGEMDTAAEDGEILEDGEIASDQDGEIREEGEDGEYMTPAPSKSSPSRPKVHKEEEGRERKNRNRKERHSKRRRSKEDGHKEKQQKKKRHRDYVDYDKTGDDYEPDWTSGERPEKRERKGDRSPAPAYPSPSHDSHGEDGGRHKHDKDGEKHRRGSGDNRKSGRERDKNHHERDKKRDKNREGPRDQSERGDKHEKNKHDKGDRDSRRERHGRDTRDRKNQSDGYEDEYSPPGIYDSPSDEDEYGERFGNKKPKTLMSMVEDEYMDPSLAGSEMEQPLPPKNNNMSNKKLKKREKWLEHHRRLREMEREGDYEEEQPVKKKPLLQTPMEERPACRFFKEGKCQKGADCPFNHCYMPQKRIELCKYYVQSYCRKMDECVFMHSEFPCKYFHTGSTCYQGDSCKFSHDPLTEITEIALQNVLNGREDYHKMEEYDDGYVEQKKFKKKALLGDQPLSKHAIDQRLEHMRGIPSIFDIETHAPTDSPRKPNKMGQSPNMVRPPGFYPDSNMSPQGGPNMRFNAPMNQGTPPRPPFMNGPPQGMEGSPMGMQGPPMNGPGQGMMGQGPPGMMQGPPQGPGMQGPPMGPPMNNQPMSQAAALVGALLRAAPMLQQYRGPATSMANEQGFNQPPMNMGMMGQQGQMGQNPMTSPGQMDQQQQEVNQDGPPPPQMPPSGFPPNSMGMVNQGEEAGLTMNPPPQMAARDPRKMAGAVNQAVDMDMRTQDMDISSPKDTRNADHMDEDLRQDVDLRKSENSNSKKGNTTPQQDWDEEAEPVIDDTDIPAHLPPKQREMFIRIRQHTMKMNMQKNKQEGNTSPVDQSADKPTASSKSAVSKEDNWYSSDEEDDAKPNVGNILENLNKASSQPAASSFNVMQMINAVKNTTPSTSTTTSNSRPSDPRKEVTEAKAKPVIREPTIINSQEGDCPWRLCRVLYVRHRIPDNLDTNDSLYKNDPRVQKMIKLQEIESGQVIDHSKTALNKPVVKSETSDPKPPLLDPRIFTKEPLLPRPELAPFVDPTQGSSDAVEPRVKSEPSSTIIPIRPSDPRKRHATDGAVNPVKPMDPRIQQRTSIGQSVPSVPALLNIPPPMPTRPIDPRLARQDSNSGSLGHTVTSTVNITPASRPLDPRLARQTSRDVPPTSIPPSVLVARSSTPPLSVDPRLMMRQNSSDPRISKSDLLPSDSGISVAKPMDPRLGRVAECDPQHSQMQRQLSQPGASSDTEGSKPKIDYRNDPRFKRKHISESSLSPESKGKRFTGQRKSSTEYSSPLGVESSKQEDSGYNSYNRPRPVSKSSGTAPHGSPPVSIVDNVPAPSSDITTHDILDSLQVMPSQAIEKQTAPDKNLKDIFKTIDPTASPFC